MTIVLNMGPRTWRARLSRFVPVRFPRPVDGVRSCWEWRGHVWRVRRERP